MSANGVAERPEYTAPGSRPVSPNGRKWPPKPLCRDGVSPATAAAAPADRRVRRVRRALEGINEAVGKAYEYHAAYMAMPHRVMVVIALWEQAAHFIGEGEDLGPWDQFPILAVSSPERECGKTTLLDQIGYASPRAEEGKLVNPTQAVLFRTIEKHRPTMILDESERFSGGEMDPFRSLMNASVRKDAKTARCAGKNEGFDPKPFSLYSPKVFAMIGDPDEVLADRCLPVRLERKGPEETVKQFRGKTAREEGEKVQAALAAWAVLHREEVVAVYDKLKPFKLRNHRRADLLMPLQAVATVLGGTALAELEGYAHDLEAAEKEAELNSPRVKLLAACREIFAAEKTDFLRTETLLDRLWARKEETWGEFSYGRPISAVKLAELLRPFKILPGKHPKPPQDRGYFAASFKDAWARYLPVYSPNSPVSPPNPPSDRPAGYDAMLKTERWAAFAAEVREFWGHKCAACNRPEPLDVHHRTYERLGKEELTDCLPLCGRCHQWADANRQEAKR